MYILRSAASKLKDNKYKNSQIFISDVSKTVRDERAKLRKGHLPDIKAETNVLFAFIPRSAPVQILYKEDRVDKLKSFNLPKCLFTKELNCDTTVTLFVFWLSLII